jgi:hypothetical protein
MPSNEDQVCPVHPGLLTEPWLDGDWCHGLIGLAAGG